MTASELDLEFDSEEDRLQFATGELIEEWQEEVGTSFTFPLLWWFHHKYVEEGLDPALHVTPKQLRGMLNYWTKKGKIMRIVKHPPTWVYSGPTMLEAGERFLREKEEE